MTVTHMNRSGQTYYLHQGQTQSGKPQYFFALSAEGDLVDTIPVGYEIYENPNAQVFLRRIQPRMITEAEVATVEAGMKKHCRLERFVIDVKKNTIVIYTPNQDVDLLADTLSILSGAQEAKVKAALEKALTYSPMLQFVLTDKKQRLFETRRYCFLGAIDDWITIGSEGPLAKLVKTYVKHLGEESYYELC